MNQYLSLIESGLEKLNFKGQPQSLYEPANYMMGLGGKRIRPILVLMGCNLFGGNIKKALNPALAMEVFHNFTLVHDDFMDNASMRRGKMTIHKKWNVPTAILSGDMMLIAAYNLLCEANIGDLKPMILLFNNTAIKVCEGQQMDMEFQQQKDLRVEDYIEMIGLKTAALLAGSLKLGALIAGANEKDAQLLYDFGYKLGISFQIQDDLLDSFGDASSFGKTIGGDIVENKNTILAIKAKELATPAIRTKLESLGKERDAVRKVELTLTIYQQLGVKKFAENLRENYYHEALICLERINAEDDSKNELKQLAAELMNRVK